VARAARLIGLTPVAAGAIPLAEPGGAGIQHRFDVERLDI
jgi:hypothetical protein